MSLQVRWRERTGQVHRSSLAAAVRMDAREGTDQSSERCKQLSIHLHHIPSPFPKEWTEIPSPRFLPPGEPKFEFGTHTVQRQMETHETDPSRGCMVPPPLQCGTRQRRHLRWSPPQPARSAHTTESGQPRMIVSQPAPTTDHPPPTHFTSQTLPFSPLVPSPRPSLLRHSHFPSQPASLSQQAQAPIFTR
jgi:hypothetical protein